MREKIIKEHNNNEKQNENLSHNSTSSNFFLRKTIRNNSLHEREIENINLLQKQNLQEIKNLIDDVYKRKEKSLENENRKNREIEKEEKLMYKKKLENDRKFIEDIQRDHYNMEKQRREMKRKEREYNEIIRKQIEEEKKEEERKKKLEKENLKRILLWQKNEEEFKTKMDNKYKLKHELLEKKQLFLEKKKEERLKKISDRRKKIDEKLKYESKLRNEVYQNAMIKNEELIKERKDKYINKQNHIKKVQE